MGCTVCTEYSVPVQGCTSPTFMLRVIVQIIYELYKVAATDSALIIVGHGARDYDYTFKRRRFNATKLSVCCNEAS
jgi:hypothetical protein